MAEYKVWEIGGSCLDGKPKFRITREWTQPGDEPFLFCPHSHETREEASQCRDFGRGE